MTYLWSIFWMDTIVIAHSDFMSIEILANLYLLRVDDRNTRKRCEIYSKLTTKTPEWRHRMTSFSRQLHVQS